MKAKGAFLQVLNLTADDMYMITAGQTIKSSEFWRLGNNNKLPEALAIVNRKSPIHRGILKAKTIYIGGRGLTCEDTNTNLRNLIAVCNGQEESLDDVLQKVIFDKLGWGNGYIEIVKPNNGSWISIYHQDTMKCRVSKDKKQVLLYHDWGKYTDANKDKLLRVDIYPYFSDHQNTGYQHSMIHLKSHEPGFENYGVVDWIAGLNVSAIAYKTNKWNISRLDNSFTSSGVLVVDGEFESDTAAEQFVDDVKKEFTGEGNQGKILTITKTKGGGEENKSKFIPLNQNTDGDWTKLQEQSITELIVAHSWYRSLTSLPDNTGFDTKRILNEYNVALNTIIQREQKFYLGVLRKVIMQNTNIRAEDLTIINKPPITAKPDHMFVWEARQEDGMEFDPIDPQQRKFVGYTLNYGNVPQATEIVLPTPEK